MTNYSSASKRHRILQHLKNQGSLTTFQARQKLDIIHPGTCFIDMEILVADRMAGRKDRDRFNRLSVDVQTYAEQRAADQGLLHMD